MEINERTRKRAASVIAVLLALAVIFAGTFAYRSVRQKALNEDDGYSNPGARLHDDFNGRNKDVYVENFTDPDNGGTPIYARIRLDEYMEIGKGAGKPDAADRNVRVIGKTDADINDKNTWATHTIAQDSHADIHKYWTWEMGGKTVFMPTFNKDKDSLEADINGTYAGPDGDRSTDGDKFKDYHEYDLGEEKTDTAIYGIDNQAEETHRAKETLESKVITMAEWKAMGAPIGNYWVYDVDGWAYWAQAIEPGEATGLLTTGIKFNNVPSEEWYYGVNVLGEFATAGDWGDKEGNTGFYEEGITEDGLFLLNHVSGALSNWTYDTLRYMPVGTTQTARIDNIEWYVLAKSGNRALLWSKTTVGENRRFGTTNRWKDSEMRTYLNNELINTLPLLKEKALATNIFTRTQYNVTTWDTTNDKLFLLSEADLFGKINNTEAASRNDYTYGNKALVSDINMMKSNNYYILRSPCRTTNGIAYMNNSDYNAAQPVNITSLCYVRPAMWVQMP